MQKEKRTTKNNASTKKNFIFFRPPSVQSLRGFLSAKIAVERAKKIILFKIIHICQLFLFSPIDNVGNMPYTITRNEK